MQFSFMSEKETIHDILSCKCCMSIMLKEKVIYVPRKMLELEMRMKGMPKVLVGSVISLYEGAKTRVK